MKYVIIGNGISGNKTAIAVRIYDSKGDVAFISHCKHLRYHSYLKIFCQ